MSAHRRTVRAVSTCQLAAEVEGIADGDREQLVLDLKKSFFVKPHDL